jgi:hypothetical protein
MWGTGDVLSLCERQGAWSVVETHPTRPPLQTQYSFLTTSSLVAAPLAHVRPHMAPKQLPPELLKHILEFMHYPPSGIRYWQSGLPRLGLSYKDIRAAMLVCREWKVPSSSNGTDAYTTSLICTQVIAEEVISVFVTVHNSSYLLAVLQEDLNNSSVRGRPWGHRIQHLSPVWSSAISRMLEGVIASNATIAILAHTSQLRSYATNFRILKHLEASHLAVNCASTLTSLSTSIYMSSDGIFPWINALKNLEHLSLRLFQKSSYGSIKGWRHPLNHSLQLPKLNSLFWHHMCDDDELLVFLAHSSFGPQCYLWLDASGIDETENLDLLRPFFAQNAFRKLHVIAPALFLTTLAPELLAVPEIEFDSIPPPGIVHLAPALPERTFFPYQASVPPNTPQEEDFWEFMHELVYCDTRPAGRTATILIQIADDFCRAAEAAEFVEKLKVTANVLIERGIMVELCPAGYGFDEQSKACFDGLTIHDVSPCKYA